MNLAPLFKSIADQDPTPIVICDLEHIVVYMNPAAQRAYASPERSLAVGSSILDCHNANSAQIILRIVDWFRADVSHNRVYIAHRPTLNRDQYMVALRDEDGTLLGYYEKHEYRTAETAALYDMPD